MTDNSKTNSFVNNVDNTIQLKIILEKERSRVGKEVIANLHESEKTWEIFSKKQDILHRLYKEQLCTSDNFTKMNKMKIVFHGMIAMETSTRIKEIDEEANRLLILLEDFEKKLDRSGKIVKDFIRDMRVHLAKMRKELDTVTNANAVEDMADMDIPKLDWMKDIPDPEIEEIADHWDHMRLKPRTTKLLNDLMSVIHGNL